MNTVGHLSNIKRGILLKKTTGASGTVFSREDLAYSLLTSLGVRLWEGVEENLLKYASCKLKRTLK